MEIRVLLFAALREAAGAREVWLQMPAEAAVADLRERLAQEYPALARLLTNAGVAVNEEYADAGTRLRPGDTVALIPPVSGG
jgi:molybdopterin converting factor subunit 1